MQAPAVDEDDRIETVKSLLDVASRIVSDLQNDPLLARLVSVFVRMPEADREIIIGALEREVQTRLLSSEVADTLTKIALRPNPNARLYLRVVEPEDKSNEVEMMAFLRAAYSVQRGIDALDPQWRTMVVLALRQMDPEARSRIDQFNRTMRMLLDEAASDVPAGESATDPTATGAEQPLSPPPRPGEAHLGRRK